MEIRALAERVLHGGRLADKLVRPGRLTDDHPGPARRPPQAPARDEALGLDRARSPLPAPDDLRDPSVAARWLDTFANHELQAIELMAVALLRAPEAAPAWRRDVARTLVEEQQHLRLYVERLEQLGHTFGATGLSRFFWDRLRAVEGPRAFSAAMGLTLEQANLDFADHFRRAFAAAGDPQTADLLARVHRDEIRHVRHGLQVLDPDGSLRAAPGALYRAWLAALPEGLAPSRARGLGFDAAGRTAAGLPPDYTARVRLCRWRPGARGCAWTADLAVEAHAAGQTLPRAATEVAEDLAPLVLFLAAPGDTVRVPRLPSGAHLEELHRAGVALPNVVDTAAGTEAFGPYARRTGWALPGPDGAPLLGRWLRKSTARPIRDALQTALRGDRIDDALTWRSVTFAPDAAALLEAVTRHASEGRPCLVKPDLGAAGRGQVQIPADVDAARAAAHRLGRRRGPWVVEERLVDVQDVSLLFDLDADRPFRGLLQADVVGGRFVGHRLGTPLRNAAPPLREAWFRGTEVASPLRAAALAVADRLPTILRAAGLRGPVGVDAALHRTARGWRLEPLLELNPRHTMGHVALTLRRRVTRSERARWRIRGLAHRDLPPPVFEDGRLAAGALPLTDPTTARRVVAWLEVEA